MANHRALRVVVTNLLTRGIAGCAIPGEFSAFLWRRRIGPALTLLLVTGWVGMPLASAGDGAQWQVGVASRVITPTESMWMGGYAARDRPSEGKIHDLYAKALAIEDRDGTRLIIVAMDLIGVPRSLRDEVTRRAQQHYGLPPESLVINASHTHCGPEFRVDKASIFGLDPGRIEQAKSYAAMLETALDELIGEALQKLAPAEILLSGGRAGFAMNRRRPTAEGIRNSPNPDGPVDHEVPVLRVERPDGKLAAIVMGYACHNTTMSFYKFFGDYAGYAQQFIEQAHPGVTALFLAGCGGDQNPYPRRTLELAQQHGRALANAVETALQVVEPRTIEGPLRVAAGEALLSFAQPPTREQLRGWRDSGNQYEFRRATILLEELENEGRIRSTYPCPLQVSQFGKDLTLVTLAGEPVVDYSLRLKTELRGESAVWVAGYCHDVFGYLPTRRVLLEGGYEGGGAMRYTALPGPFAPDVEETIIAKVRELAHRASAKRGR